MRASRKVLFGAIVLVFIGFGCSDDDDNVVFPSTTVVGSGVAAVDVRPLTGAVIGGVNLAGIGDLDVDPDVTPPELIVTADDNILQHITSSVAAGVLTIRTAAGINLDPVVPIRYELNVDGIDDIVLSGVGSIDVSGISLTSLDVVLSGVGDVVVTGTATSQTVTMSGVGTYRGLSLNSNAAVVVLSGVGDIFVAVSDTLDATLSGIGDIRYTGSPVVTENVSGTGSVEQL